jgi:hypothetical protein
MKLISLFIILLVIGSFGYQTSNDTLVARKKLKMDQPAADNTPEYLLGKNSGDSTVIACQPESLSVRSADTAGYAIKAGLLTHGTDSSYIPVATSDTTLGNSTAKMAGDTFQINGDYATADSLVFSGISLSGKGVYSGCLAPNGDCYYYLQYGSDGFYVQPGGSGNPTIVTSLNAAIPAMAADPSGNIYGFRYASGGASVYKRTGGAGSFDSIPNTRKEWRSGTCDATGVLFAGTYGDTIYKSEDAGETWVSVQYLPYLYNFSSVAPDGSIYLIAGSSTYPDIYRKTALQTQFYLLNNDDAYWWGKVGVDKNGIIYLSTSTATGTFRSTDNLATYGKIQESIFLYFVPRADSAIYGYKTFELWETTGDPIKTAFAVNGGNSKINGLLSLTNTPIGNSPEILLCQSGETNPIVKKCQPESLTVDSSRVSQDAHNYIGDSLGTQKIVTGPTTSNTTIDSTGILLNGNATVWNDVIFAIGGGKVPAVNDPAWTSFGSFSSKYTFAIDDYIDLQDQEIPHGFDESSDSIEFHVHAYTNGTDASDRTFAGVIYFAFIYPGDSLAGNLDSLEFEETIPADTPTRTHIYINVGKVSVADYTIKSQESITMRFKRVTSSGTEPSGDPYLSMVGLHIEQNRIGSLTEEP